MPPGMPSDIDPSSGTPVDIPGVPGGMSYKTKAEPPSAPIVEEVD
jgi:hypothetical protein